MFWSHIACAPKRAAFGHAGAKSKSKCNFEYSNCTLQIYLNIAGCEEFLLGIHLSDTDLWEGDRTPGTIKSKLFVDTKVWDHGYRKRNTIITGMHLLKSSTLFARCEMNLKLHAKPMYIVLFTACAQNGLALWRTGIDH